MMKGIVKFLHRDFWNDGLAGEESSEGFPAKYYYFMVSLFLVIFGSVHEKSDCYLYIICDVTN